MRQETQAYLEKVEAAIDRAHLRAVEELHAACRRYEPIPHLPIVVNFHPPDWPRFNFQEILEDREKMLLSELAGVYAGCLLKDDRLLDEFGGCIHWCGDAKAWWRSLITLKNLTAVNPYQGEFYDPVEMHAACRDAGVSIFQWTTPLSTEVQKRITTGFTLITGADSL